MIKLSKIDINSGDIVARLGQEKVMSYYTGLPIDLNRLYLSPFREDNTPTCSFYYSPSGILKLTDFGTSEQFSAVDAIMRKFALDYKGALRRIKEDESKIKAHSVTIKQRDDIEITYTVKEWDESILYWTRYGIGRDILDKYNVKNASKVFRNNLLYLRSTKDNPVFVYNFPSGTVKFYRPLTKEKKKKWYGNAVADDVGGYNQLGPYGSVCLITSSLKDVMTLRTFGIPAVCLNGEGYGVSGNTKTVMSKLIYSLQSRFRYVFFFMDSDEAGVSFSHKLTAQHYIPHLLITKGAKDISDYRAQYGYHLTWRLIKKLLKNKLRV